MLCLVPGLKTQYSIRGRLKAVMFNPLMVCRVLNPRHGTVLGLWTLGASGTLGQTDVHPFMRCGGGAGSQEKDLSSSRTIVT